MDDLNNAIQTVVRKSVERTRAAKGKTFGFLMDWRVVLTISVFSGWIWIEERKKNEEKRTVSVVALGSILLLLMYVFYMFSELIGEFLIHLADGVGSSGLIDLASQRVVDLNLYNILLGFRKSLYSGAGLNENMTNDAIAKAYS